MAIEIPISFPGASREVSTLNSLTGALEHAGHATHEFQEHQEATSDQMAAFSPHVAAAAREVAHFGRIIHDETLSALGDLAVRTAESTSHFAQLGAALGPQGELVGGIIGALLPAMEEVIGAMDRQAEATQHAAEAAAAEEANLRDVTDALEEQIRARREEARLQAGEFANADEAEDYLHTQEEIAATRDAQVAQLRERLERVRELGLDTTRLEQQIATLEAQGYQAQARAGVGERELTSATLTDIHAAGTAEAEQEHERAIRSSAAARQEQSTIEEEFWRQEVDMATQAAREQRQLEEAALDERKRREEEETEAFAAAIEERRQLEIEALDKRHELEEEEQERREARSTLAKERQQADLDKRQQGAREYGQFVGKMNSEFIDALTMTISGSKSAEDAFKGLLKSFLEMIAQQAALKAAFEYGEAIAAAAREDWAGFAQHIAGGVAFTAVAVAAGVGAAAVAPPAAPASPPAQQGTAAAQGDIVINMNAPVLTASTHGEVGRMIKRAVGAADRMGL